MNKNRKTLLFSAVVLLFVVVAWLTFKNTDFLPVLQMIEWQDFLLNFLLRLAFFISFGIIMWVGFRLHYQLSIQPLDVLTLPLMMHVFTYLMPLKGGLLFQIFYSRSKYYLDLSEGFSLGITVFLISVLLSVVVGLAISLNMNPVPGVLTYLLAVMGLGLVLLAIVLPFIPTEQKVTQRLVARLFNFLIRVRMQVKNFALLGGLIVSTLLSVFIQSLWYWQTTHILGINSTFAPIVLMVLFLRIFLVVRLVPGNLGVQELVIGVIYSAAGFTLEQGLMVAFLTRLVSVILAGTIGLTSLYSNMRYFDTDSIPGLIRNVATNKS